MIPAKRANLGASLCIASLAFLVLAGGCRSSHSGKIIIGSKNFSEQVILAELMAQHIEGRLHIPVERRFYLAGSYIAHQAVLADRIDVYPEYTGTALTAILKEAPNWDANIVFNEVHERYEKRFHLTVIRPFGFNNSFAMVVRGADARRLGITRLSQAKMFAPQWRFGCGYEFLERPDGYQGFIRRYGFAFKDTRVMDLGLLYRALQDHQVDLAAGNGTDGLITALDMRVLDDDLHYFPPYEAVPIVNDDALRRLPQLASTLQELANTISDEEMRRMNYAVDGERRDVMDVVREFRMKKGL
ncbi:MAG TPA: glycine betaine ABC transporter substrate-binding protein [Terriglobales bacterium]|nr:glycine betaine ABC transporter substrate-binding protein [Terriglobales bacterium]